jgi:type II secretory pathway pseudopilin PulG
MLPFPSIQPKKASRESGMTLLEIIFSVTLMLIMTMATASVMRNGLDMRLELSARSRVTHRINVVLSKISDDLQHAFIVPSTQVFTRKAEIKTLFRVKPWDNSSELRLTTMNHTPHRAGTHESDQTFVIYRIEKDSSTQRPNLFRGETSTLPDNLEQDIPMQLLARNIKSLRIRPWDGAEFRDEWDSSRSDWRDVIPRMVAIEVEAYSYDPLGENEPLVETDPSQTVRTLVYIPRASLFKEPKEGPKEPSEKY